MGCRAPSMGVSYLESRYLDSCRRREVFPNPSIISGLSKAKRQESRQELCILGIALDQLTNSDFPPLIDAISTTRLCGIDVVDVRQESPAVWFDGDCIHSLLRAVNRKLRIVDLQDWSYWKDILRRGLSCQILNLRFSPISKLNMSGTFMRLQTLNLDFSISLTSFRPSCFSCMPNLMRLSMCETQIANLWMTSAALSKLPSLVELRFQNCLCCYDTGACPSLCSGESIAYGNIPSDQLHIHSSLEPSSVINEHFMHNNVQYSASVEPPTYLLYNSESFTNHQTAEDSLGSDSESLIDQKGLGSWVDGLYSSTTDFSDEIHFDNSVDQTGQAMALNDTLVPMSFQSIQEVPCSEDSNTDSRSSINDINISEDENTSYLNFPATVDDPDLGSQASASLMLDEIEWCSTDVSGVSTEPSQHGRRKHISHHPSPICFEKYYREYMIASLPCLKVLDNMLIRNIEREKSKVIFKQHFELLPYRRSHKESVSTILSNRELGGSRVLRRTSHLKKSSGFRESNHSFSRSLSSAKLSSCPWPYFSSVSKFKSISREETKSFRPRQFEYHPSNPSLMVFGTLDGELVVLNHENGKLVGYVPASGALNSILGLCWLKKHPSKLIAGSDNGSLKLYDVCQMSSTLADRCYNLDGAAFSFDEFEHLTSVHINSTDELFLASGFSKHVALYDIGSGRPLQVFKDLHLEHINVVKFSHHSPALFATASFDQDIKMWDLRQGTSRPCYTVSSSRGNVMVCFSPDDHYLLSSAVDNEVKQHFAVDGRLHMAFDISSTGSGQNYTRSYYMNGRDYVISGSSEENVVRVCCAQTGRRLRDISLEGKGLKNSMFVQSLRGDPFRPFHMSVLAAYLRPSSKSEIIRVNLLASSECEHDDSCVQHWCPSHRMGG